MCKWFLRETNVFSYLCSFSLGWLPLIYSKHMCSSSCFPESALKFITKAQTKVTSAKHTGSRYSWAELAAELARNNQMYIAWWIGVLHTDHYYAQTSNAWKKVGWWSSCDFYGWNETTVETANRPGTVLLQYHNLALMIPSYGKLMQYCISLQENSKWDHPKWWSFQAQITQSQPKLWPPFVFICWVVPIPTNDGFRDVQGIQNTAFFSCALWLNVHVAPDQSHLMIIDHYDDWSSWLGTRWYKYVTVHQAHRHTSHAISLANEGPRL